MASRCFRSANSMALNPDDCDLSSILACVTSRRTRHGVPPSSGGSPFRILCGVAPLTDDDNVYLVIDPVEQEL